MDEMKTDEPVNCPRCTGTGWVACECCGSEVPCQRCEGDGEIPFGDCLENERSKLFTRREFEKALKQDAIAYAKWTGRDPIELLYLDGFEPWQDLSNKEIHINS